MYFMGNTVEETKRRIYHLSTGKLDKSIVSNLGSTTEATLS